ncbi:MAG: DUF58 domain-containing protein [Spirochaetes bacterium]|nr:DUF58 domain-containing protein [Spirochaetota bacterium]
MISPDPECDAIVRAFRRRDSRSRTLLPVSSREPSFRKGGFGFDLKTIREYQPFDDPRSIDWKLYGRTDRAYVKEYFEDESDGAAVLLDHSASVRAFDRDVLARFAFSLCYVLSSLGYLLTVFAYSDRLGARAEIGRRSSLKDLDSLLSNAQPAGRTDSAQAAREARSRVPFQRLFVVSDFHDASFVPSASGFRSAYLVRLKVPVESLAGDAAELEIDDPETGDRIHVPWDDEGKKLFRRYDAWISGKLASDPRTELFVELEPGTERGPVYRAVADKLHV